MSRVRAALATAAITAALAAQSATAQTPAPETSPPAGAPPFEPAPQSQTVTAAPVTGAAIGPPSPAPTPAPTPAPAPAPVPDTGDTITDAPDSGSGGGGGGGGTAPVPAPSPEPEPDAPSTDTGIDLGGSTFMTQPAIVCEGTTVPPELLPIYQAASNEYDLGPQGPAILAAINQIETNFGELNGVTSYAGAIGWMQFMPATWAAYGVDADGNGTADPYDPDDAIFSAANYLSASGMPEDTPGAIFAYNHADWYVAEVLANAGCFGSFGANSFALTPSLPVFTCTPAEGRPNRVPEEYLAAFEDAAGRYDLGRRGVWALAAVARLESNFGKSMTKQQLRTYGPLGLDATEWQRYAVDGDEDGRIRHASPGDSAATLARLIWARDGLRAGVFSHNQASWYVEEVMEEADRMAGECKVTSTTWEIALPKVTSTAINWDNLILLNPTQMGDLQGGLVDPRVVGLIAMITQEHTLTISSLRTDHSMLTTSGNVSNHYYGRALDIAAVDGVPCTDVSADSPCSVLGRTLTLLAPEDRPDELIYCFDLDGAGPAFAAADHCDHIHAGFSD